RGWQCERHVSPHSSPLPRGEGESSAGFQHNPARCLPDEPPEQPKPAAGCSLSPWERARVRAMGLPFAERLGPLPKLSKFASPQTEPEVSHDHESASELCSHSSAAETG